MPTANPFHPPIPSSLLGAARQFSSQYRPYSPTVQDPGPGSIPNSTRVGMLSPEELKEASKLARLSGFCYLPPHALSARLQAEGLVLVAEGRTHFTRYGRCMEVCQPQIVTELLSIVKTVKNKEILARGCNVTFLFAESLYVSHHAFPVKHFPAKQL